MDTMEDLLNQLTHNALIHELTYNKNPYITVETLYRRILKKLETIMGSSFLPQRNTELFYLLHDEILEAYNDRKKSFSIDEQNCIERVLAKDAPHTNELLKFGTIWMKHEPLCTFRWFAVDGTMGNHHKAYIQEAFNPSFKKHSNAVRKLYEYYDTPEMIKKVIDISLGIEEDCDDQMINTCVEVYKEAAGTETIAKVLAERRQKQILKRKRDGDSQ